MSFTRTRRTAVAAVSMSALLLAAACGSGGSEGEPGGETSSNIDMSEKGPITFVQGKDTSGNVQNELDAWNKEHPDEKVTLVELPDNADQQRAQMIQNAQTKGSDYTILNVDVVWTAEFAANGWIDELPEGTFDLEGFLQPTIDSATYFDKLYAVPVTSDGGMLYYRTDLLKEVGAEPPETWDEMKEICGKVQEKHAEIDCYAGQYQKYEGLTVNFAEAVNSSGGVIVGEDGKPAVDTRRRRPAWTSWWTASPTAPSRRAPSRGRRSRVGWPSRRAIWSSIATGPTSTPWPRRTTAPPR